MADNLFYNLESEDGFHTVTLNRPPANALDIAFATQLADLFESLELNPHLRAVVVTGAGSCFSAGLDLKVLGGYSVEEQDAMLRAVNRMCLALYGLRRPTIVAVNGHAIAGGLIMLLCCDVRIGPVGVGGYGLTEGQVGVAFPMGALVPAVHELGPSVARRLMLGARTYGPEEALADGVLDELVPSEDVLSRAQAVARERMKLPSSYGYIKQQIRKDALDRIRRAVREGDPEEGRWLSEEVSAKIETLMQNRS